MLVKHAQKLENGTLEFEGVLQPDELAFVVEMGLNIILAHGANSVQQSEETIQ